MVIIQFITMAWCLSHWYHSHVCFLFLQACMYFLWKGFIIKNWRFPYNQNENKEPTQVMFLMLSYPSVGQGIATSVPRKEIQVPVHKNLCMLFLHFILQSSWEQIYVFWEILWYTLSPTHATGALCFVLNTGREGDYAGQTKWWNQPKKIG